MCAPHPIPANASANATYYTPRAALAVLADEMHAKCEELFDGASLGPWAAALVIDSYADRIERTLGIQPMPKGAVDPVMVNPPMNAVREPCALPDTIAEARRSLDRDARGDIAFHVVLLVAALGIIAAAILA